MLANFKQGGQMGNNGNFNFFSLILCLFFSLTCVSNLAAFESPKNNSAPSYSKKSINSYSTTKTYGSVSARQHNHSVQEAEELANLSELRERALNAKPDAGHKFPVDRRFNRR
jgi:hypothetical protein